MADDITNEITRNCLLTRTRRISRIITGIYDEEYRPFGVNAPQVSLLVMISRLGSASRAEIGRQNNQDRSTLTRNLQLMISNGWIEEVPHEEGGRKRAIVLTKAGKKLLSDVTPAWRAAQRRGKALLGESGAAAIKSIADGL
jgi:DNA-binding MarR family transcriptional regulator